jgi:hypothetical protein
MLVIKHSQGLFRAQTATGQIQTAQSLERLIERLEPGAPPEKIAATAELLERHIGDDAGQIRQGVVS